LTLGSLFDGLYHITQDGRLFSSRSNKYLRPATDRYGYKYYVISINQKRITLKAHRLVALAYIPNHLNKPTVNHLNGIKTDNRIENLEWATAKEQANEPIHYAKLKSLARSNAYKGGLKRNFGRKRVAVYKNGNLVNTYPTLKIAARTHNVNYGKASECANGKRKTIGGYTFAYIG
jgi:uncharacterized protein Veg